MYFNPVHRVFHSHPSHAAASHHLGYYIKLIGCAQHSSAHRRRQSQLGQEDSSMGGWAAPAPWEELCSLPSHAPPMSHLSDQRLWSVQSCSFSPQVWQKGETYLIKAKLNRVGLFHHQFLSFMTQVFPSDFKALVAAKHWGSASKAVPWFSFLLIWQWE